MWENINETRENGRKYQIFITNISREVMFVILKA